MIDKELLIELHHRQNKSLNKIEKELGVSRYHLEKFMKENNIEKIRHAYGGSYLPNYRECSDLEEFNAKVNDGWSGPKLMDHYNITRKELNIWLKLIAKKLKFNPYKIRVDRKDLYEMYVIKEMSSTDIAKIYNTTNVTILSWLKRYNIAVRDISSSISTHMKKKYPMPTENNLRELYREKKMSIADMALHYNVENAVVRNWLIKNNIERRCYKSSIKIYREKEENSKRPSKEILEKYYLDKKYSVCQLEKKFKTTKITKWLAFYNIPIRSKSESKNIGFEKGSKTKLKKYGYPYFSYEAIPVSKAELEIKDYFNSMGFNFRKTRSLLENNFEVDMYDEKRKFAIEFCGVYWHCEKFKDRKYHYNKYKQLKEQGIELITVFDIEWNTNSSRIRNFLSSKLGIFNERIYARDCVFTELDYKVRDFFEENHIQRAPRRIERNFALLYGKEMVGAVSYATHHRNNIDMTLNRIAFKKGVQVVGGASKLIKNSLLEIKEPVITWSDNRWTNGKLYEKCGFDMEIEYVPDYFYTNFKEIRSKHSMMKSNIGCPDHITEHEFCNNNGWYRIYDCGKKKWSRIQAPMK